jgi:hypothetical protein
MDDDNPTLQGKGRGWGQANFKVDKDVDLVSTYAYVTTNDAQTLESNGSTDESDWSMMKN